MNTSDKIGNRIRHLREQRGLTQEQAAKDLLMARSTYAKLESGERDLKTTSCILLADYYGVTCDYLLRGIEAENVDFCKKTGLTQESVRELKIIETLRLSEEQCRAQNISEHDSNIDDYGVQEHVINAIIQDRRFRSILGSELVRACKSLAKIMIYWHTHEVSEENIKEFDEEEYGIRLNAARYIAGQEFSKLFLKVCHNQEFFLRVSDCCLPPDVIEKYFKDGEIHAEEV